MPRIPEKDLEDWVCANLAAMYPKEWSGHANVIDRQWRLPSGRVIDVFASLFPSTPTRHQVFSVIEIKAEVIDQGAVIQLLRYAGEMRRWMQQADRVCSAPRIPIMDYVLAAPAITQDALLCVEAVDCMRFVQLDVEIRATHIGLSAVSSAGLEELA